MLGVLLNELIKYIKKVFEDVKYFFFLTLSDVNALIKKDTFVHYTNFGKCTLLIVWNIIWCN